MRSFAERAPSGLVLLAVCCTAAANAQSAPPQAPAAPKAGSTALEPGSTTLKPGTTLKGPAGARFGAVSFSGDGKLLAIAGDQREISILDVAAGRVTQSIETQAPQGGVRWLPDGSAIAAAGADGKVLLWHPVTKAVMKSFASPRELTALSAGGSSSALLAAGLDGAARLYDLQQSGEPKVLQADLPVLAAALSADGQRALTGHARSKFRKGRQSTLVLWDVASGSPDRRPLGPAGDVLSVALDPQGKWFAAGDAEGNVYLYEVADADSYKVLRVGSAVRGLAFREDGALLASVSDDGSLRLWDVGQQVERARAEAHAGGALAVAFAPSGQKLATSGADGRARLWDVSAWGAALPVSEAKKLAQEAPALSGAQQHDKAKALLERAIALAPSDGMLHVQLALEQFSLGDPKGGRAELERARQLSPDLAEPWFYLGLVQAGSGDKDAARQSYLEALKRNPNAPAIYQQLMTLEAKAGNVPGAARWAHDAAAVLPRNPSALYNVACMEARSGNRARALLSLERSFKSGFTDPSKAERDDDLVSLRGDPAFAALLARHKASDEGAVATGEPDGWKKNHAAGVKAFQADDAAGALRLLRQALAEERAKPSDNGTAHQVETLHWIGVALDKLDRQEEALKAFDQSLAFGSTPYTPITLQVKAEAHERLRQYAKAAEAFERALPIWRAQGQQSLLAKAMLGLANVLLLAGKYDAAMARSREALALHSGADRDAEAIRYIGRVHDAWGQRQQALEQYQLAVKKAEESKDGPTQLKTMSQLAAALGSRGRFSESAQRYADLAVLSRKLNRTNDVITSLGEAASSAVNGGDAAAALRYSDESLKTARASKRPRQVARALESRGRTLRKLKQYPAALAALDEALPLARTDGDPVLIAEVVDAIAFVHYDRADYLKAVPYLREFVELTKKRGAWPTAQEALFKLGIAHYNAGQYPQAAVALSESVSILETLRKTAQGDARREFMSRELENYYSLAYAYLRANDTFAAYRAVELSHAKVLAERLAKSDDEVAVPTVADLQRFAGAGAILVYSHASWPILPQFRINRSGMTSLGRAHAKWTKAILEGNPRGAQAVAAAIKSRGIVKKGSSAPALVEKDDGLERVVHLFRTFLQDPSRDGVRRAKEVGRVLYDELIAPHEKDLPLGEDLIIVPDGVLAFVPFEALVDPQGRYLAQKWRVRYVQSLAVLDQISKRSYSAGRKPMLAFGGAPYANAPAAEGTDEALTLLDQTLASRGSLRPAYAALGVRGWIDLPGTLDEVNALARIVPGADVISGGDVRESRVKQLSEGGELERYRVVHFATHGLVVPQYPELSALVLSQQPDGAEDGYLRMAEIGQLKLKADYVNLSACETGLGKIYGGEGVVGLTQAFLIAGANGISVSLWQVADASTAKFMQELYRIAAAKKLTFAAAAAEVKRGFIKGDYGAAWTAPYHWAPFVHYGQ